MKEVLDKTKPEDKTTFMQNVVSILKKLNKKNNNTDYYYASEESNNMSKLKKISFTVPELGSTKRNKAPITIDMEELIINDSNKQIDSSDLLKYYLESAEDINITNKKVVQIDQDEVDKNNFHKECLALLKRFRYKKERGGADVDLEIADIKNIASIGFKNKDCSVQGRINIANLTITGVEDKAIGGGEAINYIKNLKDATLEIIFKQGTNLIINSLKNPIYDAPKKEVNNSQFRTEESNINKVSEFEPEKNRVPKIEPPQDPTFKEIKIKPSNEPIKKEVPGGSSFNLKSTVLFNTLESFNGDNGTFYKQGYGNATKASGQKIHGVYWRDHEVYVLDENGNKIIESYQKVNGVEDEKKPIYKKKTERDLFRYNANGEGQWLKNDLSDNGSMGSFQPFFSHNYFETLAKKHRDDLLQKHSQDDAKEYAINSICIGCGELSTERNSLVFNKTMIDGKHKIIPIIYNLGGNHFIATVLDLRDENNPVVYCAEQCDEEYVSKIKEELNKRREIIGLNKIKNISQIEVPALRNLAKTNENQTNIAEEIVIKQHKIQNLQDDILTYELLQQEAEIKKTAAEIKKKAAEITELQKKVKDNQIFGQQCCGNAMINMLAFSEYLATNQLPNERTNNSLGTYDLNMKTSIKEFAGSFELSDRRKYVLPATFAEAVEVNHNPNTLLVYDAKNANKQKEIPINDHIIYQKQTIKGQQFYDYNKKEFILDKKNSNSLNILNVINNTADKLHNEEFVENKQNKDIENAGLYIPNTAQDKKDSLTRIARDGIIFFLQCLYAYQKANPGLEMSSENFGFKNIKDKTEFKAIVYNIMGADVKNENEMDKVIEGFAKISYALQKQADEIFDTIEGRKYSKGNGARSWRLARLCGLVQENINESTQTYGVPTFEIDNFQKSVSTRLTNGKLIQPLN